MSVQVFDSHHHHARGIRNWTYEIITPPANLAVSLDAVKTHLKIPLSVTTFDVELTAFIKAATLLAETFTRRTFINTEFRTFRDFFACCFLLKRSKASSISQIQFLLDGVLTVVDPTIFFFTDVTDYSEVHLNDGKDWPDEDDIEQAVRIEFIAGYGVDESFVPEDIKLALKMMVANFFVNRGDCGVPCGDEIPCVAKALLSQYRIIEISTRQKCL